MRKAVISLLLFLNVFSMGAVLVPATAQAATAGFCAREVSNFLSFPTWYKYLNPRFEGGECKITFKFPDDLVKVALAIFEIVLRIAGIVAVVFVFYGGFLYLTSTGEPDRAKNARTTIINALVGLVISMMSVAIVNIVGRNIG